MGFVATATNVMAQSTASIVVEGNRRVEADTIRSYFRANPGESLDSYKIDQALKSLYATGLFQDVRIDRGAGGRIVVTVVENPVLNRVAFEGNKKLKDEQITMEVQSKSVASTSVSSRRSSSFPTIVSIWFLRFRKVKRPESRSCGSSGTRPMAISV
jgi:outer membrane protein insertion porin family